MPKTDVQTPRLLKVSDVMPPPLDLGAEREALEDEEEDEEDEEKPAKVSRKRQPKGERKPRRPRQVGSKVATKAAQARIVEEVGGAVVREMLRQKDAINPRNIRVRTEDARYCYRCATPVRTEMVQCPRCGGTDFTETRTACPSIEAPDDLRLFSPPWDMLPWPTQGTVSITGGPGSGKSSLAGLLGPSEWLTKEQDPKPVGAMFRRLGLADKMPKIVRVETVEHVANALSMVTVGPIVLDSLTAFGLIEALQVAHVLSAWTAENDNRALAVLQVNKQGQSAGYMELPHLFDACVEVGSDPFGVREFHVIKSRWSPLGDRYWRFDKLGKIEVPAFDAAYSVEGHPGGYYLHPYPMKGARWNGLFALMEIVHLLKPGMASAAAPASYMPHKFITPQDFEERRRFAEDHGLTWIQPADLADLVDEQKGQEE